MTISYKVFRGSPSGKIFVDEVTREDLSQDEVLVRLESSGVCGTDEHMRHTAAALGHEGVGIVDRIGSNVSNIKVSVWMSLF